jgi:hypothetical protein
MTCATCKHDCEQGRTCPNRDEDGRGIFIGALIGIVLWVVFGWWVLS